MVPHGIVSVGTANQREELTLCHECIGGVVLRGYYTIAAYHSAHGIVCIDDTTR